jgi:Domain of unknown function (DUF4292)
LLSPPSNAANKPALSPMFFSQIRRFPLLTPMVSVVAFLFLSGMSVSSDGCKKKNRMESSAAAVTSQGSDFLRKKMLDNQNSNAQSLTAKADVRISGDGGSLSASANIVWLKDSAVWMTVRKFGLEAARVLITPDSVFVLNRLEKTYTASDLKGLQQQYSLPAGFEVIQQFILGRPWIPHDATLETGIRDSLHWLHAIHPDYEGQYFVEAGSWQLRRQYFAQKAGTREILFLFDALTRKTPVGYFPYERVIQASSPETGKAGVEIDLKEVEFNTRPAYKFEVPGHYKRQ